MPSPPLFHQPTAVQVLLPHSPETTFTSVTASHWLLAKHRDRSQRDLLVAFDVLTTLSTLKCWGLSLPHHGLLGLFPVGGHFFLVSFMRFTSCNYPLWLVFLRLLSQLSLLLPGYISPASGGICAMMVGECVSRAQPFPEFHAYLSSCP